MKKILALSIALMMVLSLAACGGKTDPTPSGGGTTNPTASKPDSTPDTTSDNDKVPETPADFLAKFGLTEADIKPSDAGEGVLTLNPNDSNYGQVVYDGTESLNDPAAREEFFNKVLEKTRSLATDGEVYFNVSSKEIFKFEEGFFKGSFNSATWQYNYETGYVTFALDNIGGALTVTLQK